MRYISRRGHFITWQEGETGVRGRTFIGVWYPVARDARYPAFNRRVRVISRAEFDAMLDVAS